MSQYTTHTHTSAEELSQYSEYTKHCSPTAGTHSPRTCRYAILYTAAFTHIAVPARPALPAANTYEPVDLALLPAPDPPQIPPLPPTLARTSQSLSIYFNAKTTFRTFFKQVIKQLKHKQSVEYVESVKR